MHNLIPKKIKTLIDILDKFFLDVKFLRICEINFIDTEQQFLFVNSLYPS